MATTRTFLIDASTRHAIFVQRFAGGQINDMKVFLERVKRDTQKRLAGVDVTALSKTRLTGLLKKLDGELEIVYARMGKKFASNMKEFANEEAGFSQRMFTKAADVEFVKPTNVAIQAAIIAEPLKLGTEKQTIEQALRQFSKKKRLEIANVIKDGVVAGRTNDEIIKDLNFTANRVQKNHAAALVRTVTNQVSQVARQLTIEENSDVVKGVLWISTLDGNTTETCQALDGREFPIDSGPRPPIHWGCRSTVIPVVKDEFSVRDPEKSERPAVGPEGAETVSGQTTYNTWLTKQPAEFQDEVLGKDKGRLFRQGGLPVRSFVDKNFEPLTLEQLKRKEPAAFKKAGLTNE